ncbi:ABC transporter ATP-binding protein [Parapedobacter lycopersici]|uniref:ABC transporter ATP-binding protein n=1 Tax=Parapedobacter lycopersici TaxID=1864939 RepID=UPI00214DA2DC
MEIVLEDMGRRFNREWIFRHLDYRFSAGQSYAVLGPNGSGKSTLLQVIASSLTPSTGHIRYALDGSAIAIDQVYRLIAIAAPYMELIEEFTLAELVAFHFSFKKYLPGYDLQAIIELTGLQAARDKALRHFSSGMRQRVKLALACCSDVPVLLLDEPTSNLDRAGIDWYLELVRATQENRLLIVCSNQEHEYRFCTETLRITDYKQA